MLGFLLCVRRLEGLCIWVKGPCFHLHPTNYVTGPNFPVALRKISKLPSSFSSVQFSRSVVSNSLQPHGLPAVCRASLSITNSWSLLKLMSIELVMPSNHLILHHPLLLLSSIFPSIRVFSIESFLIK